MSKSVFIDGVEYIRFEPQPTIGIAKVISRSFQLKVFVSTEAMSYLVSLPNKTFTASNGFMLVNCGNGDSELKDKQLKMRHDTFTNRAVELVGFFHNDASKDKRVALSEEVADCIVIALKELAAVAPKKRPEFVSNIPNDFEKY